MAVLTFIATGRAADEVEIQKEALRHPQSQVGRIRVDLMDNDVCLRIVEDTIFTAERLRNLVHGCFGRFGFVEVQAQQKEQALL